MNEFIEKNRRLLKIYCVAARIIGWLILILGGIGILTLLVEQWRVGWEQGVVIKGALGVFQRSWFPLMSYGLVALGVSQFIRYLFDRNYQQGWILRYADKILYVFALFAIWRAVGAIWIFISNYDNAARMYLRLDISPPYTWLLLVLPVLLLCSAKLLAIIGLAQALRRIMPIIEESKTLV